MLWFLIAIIGYLALALAFILDKFILTDSVDAPGVYTFYSTIIMLGAFALWPFGVELLVGIDWLWATVSGVGFGLGLWFLYIAVNEGETSHITPFQGAFVTISSYVLGALFLNEQLSQLQIWGIMLLVLASFLLSFEKSRKHNGFHIGFVWAAVAGFCFAVSHVSAKYLYDIYPFLTGFMWTRATTGLVGIALLMSPAVLRALRTPKETQQHQTVAKKYAVPIIMSNKVLAIIAVVAIQYAASIGSVTLVQALSGVQFVLMFFLILLFTKITPRFFKEEYTVREVVIQSIALIIVGIGSALFVI
jgi:drug/metabolite transporter (DMT)-like permease